MKPCMKNIFVIVFFLLVTLFNCNKSTEPEIVQSSSPIASFTVTPGSGSIETNFQFDASGCSDIEDDVSQLQVRWDWENDGVWDTDCSTTKTATHQYSTEGLKIIKLEVKDTGDLTDTTTQKITVTEESGTMTDQDGNVYKTVKIGNQWWMAENLKVTHYRNGDAIPEITSNSEGAGLSTGARCVYDNNESNAATYSYLYNWYAVDDSRDIAPAGWHVPTDEEWKELEIALGMSQSEADGSADRGTNEGSKLAGNAALWADGGLKNNASFGESGFSALPGGFRSSYGRFHNLGYCAYFWSSTERDSSSAWFRGLGYLDSGVGRSHDNGRSGFSIRLVRDLLTI